MAVRNPRTLFVNIVVRDLKASMDFFRQLGFEFNPQFTDENAACMIVSDDAFFMLLTPPHFARFSKRKPSDPRERTEALYAISCASRAEVDDMVKTAIGAGGSPAMDPQDHGFMYQSSFYDPDGHHWEVVWMDPKAVV
jgi:predicted lactoylglutathione lyase